MGETIMKTVLFTSVALALGLTASLPALAFPKAPESPTVLTDDAGALLLDLARRGRGADDAPGDDRRGRGRGADDGPNHASNTGTGEAVIILARRGRGGDDGPGDDNGGRGRGGDDAPGDDRGGSDAGSSDDNGSVKTSGRKKPRVKGGSGCDDAGDIAEHAACR
jgi:hypothetical protein